MTNLRKSISCLCALIAGMLMSGWARAQAEPSLPYELSASHLGVASCAGSTCHGSTIARQSNVEQNEYLVWNDPEYPDKHAEAYDALFVEPAQLKVTEGHFIQIKSYFFPINGSLFRRAGGRLVSANAARKTAEVGAGRDRFGGSIAGGDTWQDHFA